MPRGKHSAPSWWQRCVVGTWTQNKLLSRKWWMAAGSLVAVVVLDVLGFDLNSDSLEVLEIVIPAYLAVEGALDWRWKRKKYEQNPEEVDMYQRYKTYSPYQGYNKNDGGDV